MYWQGARCMEKLRQFTATLYIFNPERTRVLLIKHPKLGKWLPAGGHMEPGELPHETALREAFEETGYEVHLDLQENVWVGEWNASSIPRPFHCLLEEIPSWKGEPAHQHIDMIYTGTALSEYPKGTSEKIEIRWFTQKDLEALSEEELFEETRFVIKKLFLFQPERETALSLG